MRRSGVCIECGKTTSRERVPRCRSCAARIRKTAYWNRQPSACGQYQVDPRHAEAVAMHRWHDTKGYLSGRPVDGTKRFYMHQYVWLLEYGYRPPCEIDHIDGDKRNNRIENLRLSTRAMNLMNRPSVGVRDIGGGLPWEARIKRHGEQHIRRFLDAESAISWRDNAKEMIIEFEALRACESTVSMS